MRRSLHCKPQTRGFSQARLARGSFKINGSKELRLPKQLFICMHILTFSYVTSLVNFHFCTFSCVTSLVHFHFSTFSCVASLLVLLLLFSTDIPLRLHSFLHASYIWFLLKAGATEAIETCLCPLERNAPQPLKTDVELWLPDPPSCAKLGIIAVFGRSRTRVLFSMFEVGWWKTPGVDASRSVCKLCGRANKRQR